MSEPTSDVFEIVLARSVVGRPWEVWVSWSAPQQGDRLVQAYVDQEWVAVTGDASDRELWLTIDASRRRTLELLAVPRAMAGEPLAWRLPSREAGLRHAVTARVLRDEAWPPGSMLHWQADGGRKRHEPVWPAGRHRGGFGGLFGLGAFGFDHATGPGLGRGELGWGPLGADAESLTLIERDLPAGPASLSLRLTDGAGVALAAMQRDPAALARPPQPAGDLSFDGTTLTWT